MMKTSLALTALLLGLVSTGCKKEGAAGSAGAASDACATQIGKAITAMTDKVKTRVGGSDGTGDMANAMFERMEKLKGALLNRCTEDKWPDAVLTCFAAATNRPEMRKCQDLLPPDQKMAIEADVTKLMLGPMGRHNGSGSGGTGMMGHGEGDFHKFHANGSGSAGSGSAAGSAAAGSGSAAGSASGW